MSTPAYVQFDATKPDGTRTGPQTIGDLLANGLALRDLHITGGNVKDWTLSQSGGTAEEPATYLFTNSTLRYRGTPTWTSGYITALLWEWSNDSGSTWATLFTDTFTVDGSGNVAATTVGGGFLMPWLIGLYGKFKALRTSYTAHAAATGTSVHGLGSISTQAASSVAITGGAIDGTIIGGTTPAKVVGKVFQSSYLGLGNVSGSTNISWSDADYQAAVVVGNWTPTFTNLPPINVAQGLTLELINPGAFTIGGSWSSVKWDGGAAPSRTVSGTDIYEFAIRDGATVRGGQARKDSR
jgi:hypothetical protein